MTDTIDSHRKQLLARQTELRDLLPVPKHFAQGRALLLEQHAALHSSKIADPTAWSFEDALLNDLCEREMRCIPKASSHSIAWMLWHTTRCEDITMNLLVAGTAQILDSGAWYAKLGVQARDTGSVMSPEEIACLSETIDLDALRGYRRAVGRQTRALIQRLHAQDMKQKVAPGRIQQLMEQGAVLEEARGLAGYWGRRTIAELLLMPATRHNLVHLNEALELKQAVKSN